MSVNAESSDGAAHAIQLFTELASGKWAMFVAALQYIISVSSEFVTGIAPEGDQGGGLVRWQTSRTATSIYHETEPENLQPFAEVADQAEDGKGYLATTIVSLSSFHNHIVYTGFQS